MSSLSSLIVGLRKLNIIAPAPKNNLTATRLPLTTDNASAGYGVGSEWSWNFSGNQWDFWRLVAFSGTDAIWLPKKDILVLENQNVDASHTDTDTDETAVFTYTVPGGLMRANDVLRIEGEWSVDYSIGSSAVYVRIRAGGDQIAYTARTSDSYSQFRVPFANQNNTASQVITNTDLISSFDPHSSAPAPTVTVDTTSDFDVTFTFKHTADTSANVATLHFIELFLERSAP